MQADPACGAAMEDGDVAYATGLLKLSTVARMSGAGHTIHAARPEETLATMARFLDGL